MKRDLKINFGILEQIRDELYQFMRALENMKASVNNIDNLLANASGKSIEAISEDKQGVITAIDTYKEQVNDVYVLISDYIGDMTAYIRPINQYGLMRVDRDDIWWNISQIEGANAVNVTKPSRYGYTPIAGYETDANNDLIAEQIEADIAYLKTRISGEISALWQIHDQQIAPFEDTDDHFKSRSETLYDRYTSWEERNKDIMLGIESGIYNFFSGLITGVIGIVDGIFSLIVNVIKYVGYGAVYLVTASFGATPDHMQIYLEEANTILAAIGKDPTLIIEGMAQNISDTYEEKGIMYSIGAVVPDILVDIFLTKGLNKIGKIANFGDSLADVGKYADEIADVGKYADDLARVEKLLEELEDVWDLAPMQRGNKIEEILAKTEYKDWFNCGQLNNGKFPTIDFQLGNSVVSLKTIDPRLASYVDGKVNTKIIEYLEDLSREITVAGNPAEKTLDVRIPKGTTEFLDLEKLYKEAERLNITLEIGEL
ncbi:TPA: deaminase domain-containing protein [Listeria monocytogenes]